MPQKRPSADAKMSSEFERIERISEILDHGRGAQVALGIGDDAATLRIGRHQLVWTTDSAVEGVHFRCDWMTHRDVGYRSFNAAVSDVAAMGAKAIGALSALELPKALPDRALYDLVEGQAQAAKLLNCPVIGGNLARGNHISVSTTVLGQVKTPLLRSGAKSGDEVWLVGEVGLANAGLRCFLLGKRRPRGKDVERCIEAFLHPSARLDEGQRLVGRAHSLIDVSDGLAGDASHVAKSSAKAIVFDETSLMTTLPGELKKVARRLGISALDCAMYGGEDYALLATGPTQKRPRFATVVGHVERGRGVWLRDARGLRKAVGCGFDHFRNSG